jgi:hypothetical protein
MPINIATACGRSDLFAFYGNYVYVHDCDVRLPVVGFDERGHALVVTLAGRVVRATKARPSNKSGNAQPFHSVASTDEHQEDQVAD